MKTIVTFLFCLMLSLGAFAQSNLPAAGAHALNEVIVKFTAISTQPERQFIVNSLGSLIGDIDNDPAQIGQIILVHITNGYPVQVGANTYNTEVDLINFVGSQNAEIDDTDLNYYVTAIPYTFDEFIGGHNMDAYSPIDANCEAEYPGGALVGLDEFGNPINLQGGSPILPESGSNPLGFGIDRPTPLSGNQLFSSLKVGILDTGLDPSYPTINQYVEAEINVLSDYNLPRPSFFGGYSYNRGYQGEHTRDGHGHGTFMAGIIAGLSERAFISNDQLELYIIKCFDDNGIGLLFRMIQAVNVAKNLNLDVVNLSWSYTALPEIIDAQILESELLELDAEDVVSIVGAGNTHTDLLNSNIAPASLSGFSNMITVGGVQCNGDLASFSNYGVDADIAAPATEIIAPGLNGHWVINATGTSFATPIVTAAFIQTSLLYFAKQPIGSKITPGQFNPIIRQILMASMTELPLLEHNYGIKGVVNFGAACNLANQEGIELLDPLRSDTHNYPSFNQQNFSQTEKSNKITLSIDDLQTYPNPFNDQLNIAIETNSSQSPLVLEIYTMQGAKVMRKTIDFSMLSNINLNTAHLLKGTYLLKITQNKMLTSKLIVKK